MCWQPGTVNDLSTSNKQMDHMNLEIKTSKRVPNFSLLFLFWRLDIYFLRNNSADIIILSSWTNHICMWKMFWQDSTVKQYLLFLMLCQHQNNLLVTREYKLCGNAWHAYLFGWLAYVNKDYNYNYPLRLLLADYTVGF